MQEIDKVTLESNSQPDSNNLSVHPLEKLRTELTSSINEILGKHGLSINSFILSFSNKLELHLDKLLEENLHNSLQLAKKELNDELLTAAKESFARFLYFLTLQKKATKASTIEAESFLKYFLVSGSNSYHFHVDGTEYFVEFIEFVPDMIQDIKEDNPRISKYKQGMLKAADLLQKLQTELFKQNEQGAQKILLQIKEIIDNTLTTADTPVSATDLLTIQRLQTELSSEPQVQAQAQPDVIKNKVSPVTVQNNPRVPRKVVTKKTIASNEGSVAHQLQRSVLNQKAPTPPESTFVKQLKKLFN